jgi:hypothetical protein
MKHYICYQTPYTLEINGKISDPAWDKAPWSDYFLDIEGEAKPKPRFKSRMKMLWDDNYLYVAASFEEPNVWAKLQDKNAIIFYDNDFEVFIDPDSDNCNYYEFEINALNTIWELVFLRTYRDGGPVFYGKNLKGLKSAVFIDGELNNPKAECNGWSVEIAFPWSELKKFHQNKQKPRHGDQWRINFSRVEWQHDIVNGKYQRQPNTKEDNWVWSPQGVIDMHRPELWGNVQFLTTEPGMDLSGDQAKVTLPGESYKDSGSAEQRKLAVTYRGPSLPNHDRCQDKESHNSNRIYITEQGVTILENFEDDVVNETKSIHNWSGFNSMLRFCSEKKIKTIIFENALRFNGNEASQELVYKELVTDGFEVILFFPENITIK